MRQVICVLLSAGLLGAQMLPFPRQYRGAAGPVNLILYPADLTNAAWYTNYASTRSGSTFTSTRETGSVQQDGIIVSPGVTYTVTVAGTITCGACSFYMQVAALDGSGATTSLSFAKDGLPHSFTWTSGTATHAQFFIQFYDGTPGWTATLTTVTMQI